MPLTNVNGALNIAIRQYPS